MAIAERHLAALFGDDIVDHTTYVLASDGDLMEGISQEAIALAGHLKLKKLIVLFDDNGISIDGPLALADSVDQVKRFECRRLGGKRASTATIRRRLRPRSKLRRRSDRPSLIACRTTIGFGAPNKAGTEKATARRSAPKRSRPRARSSAGRRRPSKFRRPSSSHGAPPARAASRRGRRGRCASPRSMPKTAPSSSAACAANWPKRSRRRSPTVKQKLAAAPKEIATRSASEFALEALTPALPEMIGGSADLTGSNNTRAKAMKALSAADYAGRFIHYGVREHGMAAAMNGMALHGGIIPYSGTFLVFSDYCRPAIRLAALMGQRVIHVMTHDSIGLGEDGPTHQPVEHLAALRAIPNLKVFRPCDAVETIECWQLALESKNGPSVLALTRQNVPQLRLGFDADNRCALRRL